MANIRELKARFTADAAILKRVFRDIQSEAGRLGPAVQRSTQQANRSFDGLQTNADRLRTALREAGDVPAFDALNRSAEQAQREIEQTGRVSASTMTQLENAVNGAGDHFNSLGADARQGFSDVEAAIQNVQGDLSQLNAASLARLQQEAEAAQRELDQIADAAQQAQNELDQLNDGGGLDEVTESAEGAAGSLGSLVGGAGGGIIGAVGAGFVAITGFVGAFVAAGAGIYGFIKSSDELKRATNALQAQTGATTEEMDGMRDSLVNIYGNNFGEGFQDIADSMANVKQQTNLTGDELESFTQNALMLRDTFEYDVAESTKAATILMKQFGIDGDKAMGLIADGTQNGLNYADDLLDTIGEYSPYYEAAGFSAEEMFGMFKNAQETGAFNLDYAADAFKEFGIIMQEDSERAKEALERIGLPAGQLIEDFSKGGETARAAFETIATKLGEVDDESTQTQVGIELFGTKFEDLGADAVIAMTKTNTSITGTQDKLEAINAVKYDTVGEAITGVGRKMVANILIPLQDRIMPGVNTSINKITGYISTASEALGAFIKGDETAADVLMSYGLDPAQFQPLINSIDRAKETFFRFREGAGDALGRVGKIIKAALVDSFPIVLSTLKNALDFIQGNLRALTSFWQTNGESIMGSLRKIADSIRETFVVVWQRVRPLLNDAMGFVMEIFGKVRTFWIENGAQIFEAISNVFNGIMAVIKFVMPAVLAIIKMVWGNIKGVITGALDIIMGVVKIFTGLFTGDFSKMWEGIKQLFKGAVVFVWNLVQLTFYGKILSGAKVFILSFKTFFIGLWQAIQKLFTGNVSAAIALFKNSWTTIYNSTKTIFTNVFNSLKNIWNSIKSTATGFTSLMRTIFSNGFQALRNKAVDIFLNLYRTLTTTMTNLRTGISDRIRATVDFARNAWSTFKTNTTQAFRDVYNAVKNRFTDIVNAAKALPGRIGDGIRLMASKVTSGITSLINSMARTLGKGINGVISGINTVLDKIGVNTEIKKWTVPQWAKGTPKGGHPGGLAIINDGVGDNAGPELLKLPDGTMTTLPGKNVLTNLPKGTEVLSAKNTKVFLSEAVAQYGLGTDLFNGMKNVGGKIVGGVKKVGSKVAAGAAKVKGWAVDAYEYVKNPGKLLDLALKYLGINKPKGGNLVGDLAVGGWNKVKDGAIQYLKDKLTSFGESAGGFSGIGVGGGNSGNFGPPFRLTSRPGPRNTGIPGASRMHKGWDWAAPTGTPIPSTTDGVGYRTGWHPLSGNFVEVKSGNKIYRYQHNSKNIMKVGQTVKKGQTIALVGATGVGSGSHLHYEPRGYENGGIVDGRMGAQLAWLTEGGFAESVISHDPAKKASQFDLWNKTGDMLGFNQAAAGVGPEALALLQRIARAVEMGHVLQMDSETVAEILRDPITKLQELDGNIRKVYKK